MFFSHRQAGNVTASPTGLKVKAARDAIDIDAFTREVEVGGNLALHRPEIDFLPANTSCCHKLGRHLFFHAFCHK